MSEDMPARMSEDMSDRMSEDMPDRMSEDMPERMSEDMSDRMSEDMPDKMPEDMPEHMPDRMPEDMSDRMPQDLPVRKCNNVMVGITRSKVIFIIFPLHCLYTSEHATTCYIIFHFRKVPEKLSHIVCMNMEYTTKMTIF